MGRTKRAAGSVLLLFCSVVRSPLLCLEKHDQSSGQWPHRTEQKLFLVSLMKEVRVCTRPSLLHNSGGRSLFLGHREPRQEQERGQDQGLRYRPVRSNRRGPVPVYRTGLAGNRSKPVEVKFEFKICCANGSYKYTGRFDRFTGRFDW